MKAYAHLEHAGAWPGHDHHAALRHVLSGFHVNWRHASRRVKLNWYQVAVVAMATFAISMDLMFPPVKIAIGQGLDVYAGHVYTPVSPAVAMQVNFPWLAVELMMIVAAAIAGWYIATTAGDRRKARRSAA